MGSPNVAVLVKSPEHLGVSRRCDTAIRADPFGARGTATSLALAGNERHESCLLCPLRLRLVEAFFRTSHIAVLCLLSNHGPIRVLGATIAVGASVNTVHLRKS